jgi:basic membrane lipoprotein Med (substrate-binding protein (PBP1-ABC) superfamily)
LPETRFVFVDASLSELSLEGVPNAAAIRFGEEDVLLLGGYLSGLMPTKDGSRSRVDRVSIVAGEADLETRRLINGFKRGLHGTNPGAIVRVDYSHELEDPTACEQLANRQIDEGSDVVVAVSGRCGLEDDYAVQLNSSDLIPDGFWSAVVHHCSRIRATRHRDI